MVGTANPSLTAPAKGGTAREHAEPPGWPRRRRGSSLAVRVRGVGLAALPLPVLSRPAADPDRGARLEPSVRPHRRRRRIGVPRARVRAAVLLRFPDRHRGAGVVARLSGAVGAAGCRRRCRMVSAGAPRAVGGGAGGGRRRHCAAADRQRPGHHPQRPQGGAPTLAAARNRWRPRRAAQPSRDLRARASHRAARHHAAAGRSGMRRPHARSQPVDRRARRRSLRPSQAAVARHPRHDVSALGAGSSRARHRRRLRAGARRAYRHPVRGNTLDRLHFARPRGAARAHPRRAGPHCDPRAAPMPPSSCSAGRRSPRCCSRLPT